MAKKIICVVFLVISLVCAFTSCGDSNNNTTNNPENPTHTHSYGEWIPLQAATCTTDGIKERYCSCGEIQTVSIPMIEHTYGEWTVVKAATTTEKGREERTCFCGKKETRDIDKISINTTVSAQEWKNAFDFSSVQELTLGIDETTKDEYGIMSINGEVTISGEAAYMNYILVYNGEEEVVQEYDNGDPLVDFGSAVLGDTMRGFWYEIEELSDLGYLQFNYDEQNASYRAPIEIYDVSCDVNLFFENGRIVKLTIVSVANADETINGTYTYSYM